MFSDPDLGADETEAVPCVGFTDVSLSLATADPIYTDTVVEFEADVAPDNAGKPYNYRLVTDGTPGAMQTASADPLVFTDTFATTGTHTVEIAVWNCEMGESEAVTDEVVIVVSAASGGNRAPNVPSHPNPADGAEDVSADQLLSWAGGDPDGDVVTYTVSLEGGSDSILTTTTESWFVPGALLTDTVYHWQITATDGLSISVGPVWGFTTTAGAVNIGPCLPGTEPQVERPYHFYLPLVIKPLGPEPPGGCDVVEVEPNDTHTDAQVLVSACVAGNTSWYGDGDWYRLNVCTPIGQLRLVLEEEENGGDGVGLDLDLYLHKDPPGEQIAGIKSAGRLDAQPAILVDMAHVKADLVHMAGDHDLPGVARPTGRLPARLLAADQVTHRIDATFVKQTLCMAEDHLPDPFFTAGNSRRLGQFLQQLHLSVLVDNRWLDTCRTARSPIGRAACRFRPRPSCSILEQHPAAGSCSSRPVRATMPDRESAPRQRSVLPVLPGCTEPGLTVEKLPPGLDHLLGMPDCQLDVADGWVGSAIDGCNLPLLLLELLAVLVQVLQHGVIAVAAKPGHQRRRFAPC